MCLPSDVPPSGPMDSINFHERVLHNHHAEAYDVHHEVPAQGSMGPRTTKERTSWCADKTRSDMVAVNLSCAANRINQ